jgi:hypothetical protein
MVADEKQEDRIQTDGASARRATRRTVRLTIIVVFLLTGFTAGGFNMLIMGDAPAAPFAVGGLVFQLSVLGLLGAALRIRSSLSGDTISRRAITSARSMLMGIRAFLLFALIGLTIHSLVRLTIFSDRWTVLTAAIVGALLWLLRRGLRVVRDAWDAALASPGTGSNSPT